MATANDDDLLGIIEDDELEPSPATPESRYWRLLVVDDDEEVHSSTVFSLTGVEILGRRIQMTHAYSAAEGFACLQRDPDFAVILLDVVMETPDAGLRLVRIIREELRLTTVRIILRTGQPGYAPELTVIRDYDINDYRTKSELERNRLLASLYAAFRAYSHIQALDTARHGLEQIITASAELFRRHSLSAFCEGVLTQLGALLEVEASGIVLARTLPPETDDDRAVLSLPRPSQPVVLAASGSYRTLAGHPLERIQDTHVKALLQRTLEQRTSIFENHASVLHITGPSGDDLAIYMSSERAVDAMDRKLLEVFSSNVALGYDNAAMFDHVRKLAFYDPLTQLANRACFNQELSDRLSALQSGGNGRLLVMLLDVDHFQAFNDGWGHAAGDALLQTVGSQLAHLFSDTGMVARLSSDMFGLLVPLTSEEDLPAVVECVLVCFSTPLDVAGHQISVKVSGGYVEADGASTDAPQLVRRAGMALKRAKGSGRGRILPFETGLEEHLHQRLSLVSRITEARANGQFLLVYQPQLRLSDGAVLGVEALLRWRSTDGAWISPASFIPVAEDAGLMLSLGDWVMRQACQQQVQWLHKGVGRLRVAVNVTMRQLQDGDLLRSADRVLAATGADPADIEMEITESNAMEDDRVLDIARSLRQMGFGIAIDDFGTGYSSLARLQQLPATLLKIDRAFVTDIHRRPDSRSIAALVARMGQELGLGVLAEGVETVEEEAVMRDLGCDSVQGFLYARPMLPAELETWLQGRTLAVESPLPRAVND